MICRDFAAVLHFVHKNGLVVGDLSARNGLYRLDERPSVMLVDCDAIRVRGTMAAMAQLNSPDWDPPEKMLTQSSDRYKFGLFVLRCLSSGEQISTTRDPSRADAALDPEAGGCCGTHWALKRGSRTTAQAWGGYFRSLLTGRRSVAGVQSCSTPPQPQAGTRWMDPRPHVGSVEAAVNAARSADGHRPARRRAARSAGNCRWAVSSCPCRESALAAGIRWPCAASSATARTPTPRRLVGPPSLRRCSAVRPAWSMLSRPRNRRAPCCRPCAPVWRRSASSSQSGSGSGLSVPDEINRHGGAPSRGVLLGLTDQWIVIGGPTTVSAIRVVAGMPPTYFGRAVAHEIGHAWLAQYGRNPVAHEIEEGLCELYAYAWLKRERSPLADWLRSQLRANPDPVYGGGFRTVHVARWTGTASRTSSRHC